MLQKQAASLRDSGVEVTALLLQGPTVESILNQSEKLKADWIVVGSHGHGALYHVWMGSVGQGLIHRAGCPVVVVPRTAGEKG
jgi:nucleotide-binding universal stress UspA family protein